MISPFSDTEVRCNSGVESTASYRSIKLPYFYQIETVHGTNNDAFLQRIERSLLTALAQYVLTCINQENEDISHLLSAGRAQQMLISAYGYGKWKVLSANQ